MLWRGFSIFSARINHPGWLDYLDLVVRQIAVPISQNANIERVQALSPTEECAPVRWAVEEHRLTMAVKELRIYQALVIDLETP